LQDCGLPTDVAIAVHGTGPTVGAELVKHVDYISFTGSTDVGRSIAVAAAQRLIGYSLELGGKNPLIVLDDAPIADAAQGLINGAFANSGQACISIERAYVQDSIFDDFAHRVAALTETLNVGWSLDFDKEMGSLIGADHADRVERHVHEATSRGATVIAGGERRRDLGDAFFSPTVLTDVPADVDVACYETFGPVVALYRVESEFEAIRLANESTQGLNASVWTGNTRRAREIARNIETGSTVVNSTMMIYHAFDAPMGGVKESGHGRRHGAQGIQRFTEPQSIVTSPSWGGGYDSLQRLMTNPRRARALLRTFKLLRHVPLIR
jgi:succinate-semialdehyde dehydrogenase/glutarate-semialdehyde dehydrogenase